MNMAPQRPHDATQEPPRAPEPLKWPPRAPNMAPKSPKNAFQERPEGPQERPKWPPRGLPEHFLHPLPSGDSMPRNRGALLGKVCTVF